MKQCNKQFPLEVGYKKLLLGNLTLSNSRYFPWQIWDFLTFEMRDPILRVRKTTVTAVGHMRVNPHLWIFSRCDSIWL